MNRKSYSTILRFQLTDRIADSIPLVFRGGEIESNGPLNEQLGTVQLVEGSSSMNLTPVTSNIPLVKRLNLFSLERSPGATLTAEVSPTAQIHAGQAPQLVEGIYPWLVATSHRSSSDRTEGFATISGSGIVPIEVYSPDINVATQAANVKITASSTLLSSDTSANSVTFQGNSLILDLNSQQLRIASGGVLLDNGARINNGTLTAGDGTSGELILFGRGQVGANIIDNGQNPVDVAVSSTGTIFFFGNNTYSGTTYVNNGALNFGEESAAHERGSPDYRRRSPDWLRGNGSQTPW